ncbi:MAG: ABC transporter ATP-binding protein [Candidatus Zixiibacteriota bacterium]
MSDMYHSEEALAKGYDSRLMKRLIGYVSPYKWHTAGGALSLLSVGALQLYLITLVQRAIDDHISIGDMDGLRVIALVYLGVMGLKFLLEYFQVVITARMGQEVQQDIRLEVFTKLQGMDLKYYDRNPVGRLVTRVTNDVNVLNELFSSGVINIIGDIILITGYVALMLFYSWQLSLAILFALPLLALATIVFRRKVREVYRQLRVTIARINAFVSERLSGISALKLFTQEARTYDRFDERNREALDKNLRQVFYYAVFFPVVEFISALSLAALIVYGAALIVDNALTFGALTAFILLVERFYRPIRDLSEKYNILQASMASSERIFQLLDTEPVVAAESAVTASPPTAPVRRVRGRIEFDRVTFAYNEPEYVLHDVTFAVEEGQKVAIVGATGSGKTSLISLLFRFYDFQSGIIRIDGRDIRDYSIPELRAQLGLVLQDVQIFSGDLARNVRLDDNTISDEKIRRALKEVGLDHALGYGAGAELDIHMEVKERGATLSTGQKQLLSFARALAFDPNILALDEATSSVDSASELLIQTALEKIMRGRTSLVVAHRLSTIEKADTILVMSHGRLCESGSHAELLSSGGIYHKLYQMQYERREIAGHAIAG